MMILVRCYGIARSTSRGLWRRGWSTTTRWGRAIRYIQTTVKLGIDVCQQNTVLLGNFHLMSGILSDFLPSLGNTEFCALSIRLNMNKNHD